MALELTQAAKDLLATRGFDPVLGARPLRRTIQREIEDVLAEKMLYGEVGPGQIVLVDVEGEEGPTQSFTFKGTPRASCPTPCRWRPRSVPPLAVPTTPRARSTCPVRGQRVAPSLTSRGPDLPSGSGASCRRGRVASGQGEPAVGERRRPGRRSSSEASARSRCTARRATRRRARPGRRWPRVSRSTASSRPRHLPVGAGVRLHRARRPVVRRASGGDPRAPVGDRARGRTAGLRGRADQRAELHHRDGPAGGAVGSSGSSRVGQLALRPGHRGRRELDAGHGARQHPAHVGVEHGVPLPVGERRDGRRGVVADAGQRPQRVVRRRHLAVVPFHDRLSGGVQAQRPSRVAEPAPGPDRLAGRLGGEGGRGRPAPPARLVQTGSTRATGVCWSMNSLTRTAHGVAPGARHGRSRACSSYQRSTGSCRSLIAADAIRACLRDPGRAAA